MGFYRTAELAKRMGVHPNTVRRYEEWGLIPKADRLPNGYRNFTEFHAEQFRLARTAFRVEVLQNGLRRTAVKLVKASAQRDFEEALRLCGQYLERIRGERDNAEKAIASVSQLLNGERQEAEPALLTRREAAERLQVTGDTLRSWEMNGLLTVKRRQNGYRVYAAEDMERLRVIRALRCANYSLAAILRMLNALSRDPGADLRSAIDTPEGEEDVISACDRLISSLEAAEENARDMRTRLLEMRRKYS